MKKNHTSPPAPQGRVIGLDLHPDVFSAAALAGRDAATAQVEQSWDRLRTAELEQWARKLQPGDVVALEASGNSFTAVERLRAAGVPAIVLESQRAGQIRKSYCANDRLDAVKLARIYLSGLAQPVWTPDETTRARRETLATYRKAVVTAVRVRNRLKSFLSDHHVRLGKGVQLTRDSGAKAVLAAAPWSSLQRMVLEEMLAELRMAHDRRQRLSAAIAREVAAYPRILQLMRLLGVRHIIAFAIMAVVGDIGRFANPRKLVAYLGLTPSVEDSGLTIRGRGALVSAGRGDLRTLLTQAAQNAMNQKASPLHAWGWKLCLRKGHRNIAVTAVARKLTVSIWYLLKGLFRPLASVDDSLKAKLTKLATAIGLPAIRELGFKSKAAFIEEKEAWLLKPA